MGWVREREISSLFFPHFPPCLFFWPFSLSLLSYYTTHYQNTNHTYIHTSIQTPTTPTLTPFFLFPPKNRSHPRKHQHVQPTRLHETMVSLAFPPLPPLLPQTITAIYILSSIHPSPQITTPIPSFLTHIHTHTHTKNHVHGHRFSWANGLFGQMVLDLEGRMPGVLRGEGRGGSIKVGWGE